MVLQTNYLQYLKQFKKMLLCYDLTLAFNLFITACRFFSFLEFIGYLHFLKASSSTYCSNILLHSVLKVRNKTEAGNNSSCNKSLHDSLEYIAVIRLCVTRSRILFFPSLSLNSN